MVPLLIDIVVKGLWQHTKLVESSIICQYKKNNTPGLTTHKFELNTDVNIIRNDFVCNQD
jgi:hypothetical protein